MNNMEKQILLALAILFCLIACNNTKDEEKLVLPQNAELVDENDFYQVFTSVEDYDSVSFTSVWLLDKEDSTVIKATDPAKVFYDGGYTAFDIEMEEDIAITDESKSILYPDKVNLVNNVKHPWILSMYCFGFRHNYLSLIVTENKTNYEELWCSGFVCRSKYEDVVFFDHVEDYTDWSWGKVTYVVYDKNMKELRKEFTCLGQDCTEGMPSQIIEKGVSVPMDAIGDSICSHDIEPYIDASGTCYERKIVETKAENGDIINFLVEEKRNKAILLPVNDEFIAENNIGLVFLSYRTYDNGKRYSVLRILDSDGNLRYEIDGSMPK